MVIHNFKTFFSLSVKGRQKAATLLYLENAKNQIFMDQELKQQLDRMEKFMFEQLVTKQEFSNLTDQVAALTESVNKLTSAVANLAKQISDFDQEHKTLKHQMMALQDWARKVSEKIGVEFKL